MSAPRVVFTRGDLTGFRSSEACDFTGAEFSEVRADGSTWERAILTDADGVVREVINTEALSIPREFSAYTEALAKL